MRHSTVIRAIIDEMNRGCGDYDAKALSVWNMLSPEEKDRLRLTVSVTPPANLCNRNPDVATRNLLDDKLITMGTYGGEERCLLSTMVGIAVHRVGNPPTNITLPGESKP